MLKYIGCITHIPNIPAGIELRINSLRQLSEMTALRQHNESVFFQLANMLEKGLIVYVISSGPDEQDLIEQAPNLAKMAKQLQKTYFKMGEIFPSEVIRLSDLNYKSQKIRAALIQASEDSNTILMLSC